jgi:hypothetical protein
MKAAGKVSIKTSTVSGKSGHKGPKEAAPINKGKDTPGKNTQ